MRPGQTRALHNRGIWYRLSYLMALLCKSSGWSGEDRSTDPSYSTSPSIYVAYTDLQASKSCFTGSRQAGGIYRHTTIAYEPDTLSAGCGLAGPWYPLNITRLFDPPTNGEMYLSEACAPIYASNQAQWLSFEAGHGQAASPQFSMPVGLKSVDPAWGACKPFPLGVWDPPRTLSAVSAMDPTTKHIATTTPVASPGVSPTPLITPTASHADPKTTDNHDPKNTADPKETANPASSETGDGLIHSAASSRADPAIDQSLGLRPSRTQDPDSHSEQIDPDPGATSRTPDIPKATAGNPGGTPIVTSSSTEDPQHLTTADQQAPSGKTTVPAVPVELPVFDPMTLIDPHHKSSHRTSTVDPASKTQNAHTVSAANSAVDAHDTGVGNAIDPAIMSKVIGIDNVFGGAAGDSTTALGDEVDPVSKTHAADIKGTINLAAEAHNTGAANAIDPGMMSTVIGIDSIFGGAAGDSSTALGGAADTTDIGSQVALASTHKFLGSGSEFDPQETARPYTAATTVAQSSGPSESTGKAGSYQSLDGGFATTSQATQSTRGLSASSSAMGASNSNFDGLSSLADGSSHGSRAKSETPKSGRTDKSMSRSNSHEVLVSHQTRTSETMITSAVGNGPQSTDSANSATGEIAWLTSSASTTDITGFTTTPPAPFLGQGTRLVPNSTVSALMWLVASALCIYPWAW